MSNQTFAFLFSKSDHFFLTVSLCIMLLANVLQVYKRQAAGICYDNGSLPFVYTVVSFLFICYSCNSQSAIS